MLVSQPTKIGKIGCFVFFTGQFFWILPIIDLIWRSFDLWDVVFFVVGMLLILVGYLVTRKDMHLRRLGWKLLLWDFPKTRDRFARGLITFGNTVVMILIMMSRIMDYTYGTWQSIWVYPSLAIIALLIGWALILTEREAPSPPQAYEDSTTST